MISKVCRRGGRRGRGRRRGGGGGRGEADERRRQFCMRRGEGDGEGEVMEMLTSLWMDGFASVEIIFNIKKYLV